MSGLVLRQVSLRAGGRLLLDRLDLMVRPGAVATLMGPSGCGKSSLLGWICGTAPQGVAGAGSLLLDGRRIDGLPPEARRVGILFQDPLLFPHLSVGGNLAFALPRRVRSRHERRRRVEAALAEARLDGFIDRDPATLSGGQRARVALMRALLAEPAALVMDEPFAALDAALRQSIRGFVLGHARERGLPLLLATHDQADADAGGGPVLRPWVVEAGAEAREPRGEPAAARGWS